MKRFSSWMILFALITITGFGCVKPSSQTTKPSSETIDRNAILLDAKKNGLIMDDGELEHMKDPVVLIQDEKRLNTPSIKLFENETFKNWHAAALADVTGGTSYGLAYVKYEKGRFTLYAKIGGLTPSSDSYHYEGWVVHRNDGMKVVDVGSVVQDKDQFIITYSSSTDLSTYDFFVLTLEPNDDNVTPAEHILEGMIR